MHGRLIGALTGAFGVAPTLRTRRRGGALGFVAALALVAGTPIAAQVDVPPVKVFFGFNTAQITPGGKATIDILVRNLEGKAYSKVSIVGHADSAGSKAQNARMSKARVDSVAAYLEQQGIERKKMELSWFGDGRQAYATVDEVREPENRRVEISVE